MLLDKIAQAINEGFGDGHLPDGFVHAHALEDGRLELRVGERVIVTDVQGEVTDRGLNMLARWAIEELDEEPDDPQTVEIDGEQVEVDGVEEFALIDMKMTRKGDEPEDIHDFIMQDADNLELDELNILLAQCRRPAMVVLAEGDVDDDIEALLGGDDEPTDEEE